MKKNKILKREIFIIQKKNKKKRKEKFYNW